MPVEGVGARAPSQATLTLSKSFHPFHGVNSIEMKSLLRGLIAGKQSCADPEGGTGGPDPPWNLKILPKKR